MKKWSNITAQHFDDDQYLLIISQNDGWDVYLDPTVYCFYLYDSRSKVKFQLPQVKEKVNGFSKCSVLSDDSSEDHSNPNPIVIMLIYDEFKTQMHYRCEVDDEQWHRGSLINPEYCDDEAEVLCDVVAFNGTFYGINSYYEILEILIPLGEVTELKPCFKILSSLAAVWFETARFIVSCNELFVVLIRTNTKFGGVFKLDVFSSTFIPIYNLGDQVFFLKGNYSTSFSGEKVGHVGNCVCYTEQGNELLYLMNLEDGTLSIQVHGGGFNNSLREGTLLFNRLSNLLCSSSCSSRSGSSWTTTVTNREAGKEEDIEESLMMLKIPLHLQEHVAKFVKKGRDYLNFRSVCTSWRSMTPTRQWKITRNEFVECPWLITIKRDNNSTCKLSDPKDNATYLMSDPELSNCVIRYSKDGWLLVSKGYRTLFLYEPFAKTKIQLPELERCYSCGNGICLSDNPSSSKLSIFAFSLVGSGWVRTAYLNPGDECWTYNGFGLSELFTPAYCNPIFSNGAFYCLSQEGDLGIFRLRDLTWEIVSMSSPSVSLPPATKMVPSFLISYDQDVYSVYVSNVAGEFVKVYKLVDILLDGGKGEWEEVTSLRNKTLFVSETSCFALVAPVSSMENMIYLPCFSLINNKHVFYCLESGKYHTFGGDGGDITTKGLCDTKELLHCTWIQPRLVASSW